jgi:hypothetical protein
MSSHLLHCRLTLGVPFIPITTIPCLLRANPLLVFVLTLSSSALASKMCRSISASFLYFSRISLRGRSVFVAVVSWSSCTSRGDIGAGHWKALFGGDKDLSKGEGLVIAGLRGREGGRDGRKRIEVCLYLG